MQEQKEDVPRQVIQGHVEVYALHVTSLLRVKSQSLKYKQSFKEFFKKGIP